MTDFARSCQRISCTEKDSEGSGTDTERLQKVHRQISPQSENSLDVDVLKIEILEYFADIPKTSPARFNHPYQYLHSLFEWCAKQDYIPYNPFDKLELKKLKDEGKVQPAEIRDIQTLLKALDKHNYTELRDHNIMLCFCYRERIPCLGGQKRAAER